MQLKPRGLEGKTLDPYLAGWHKRAVPALGHLPLRMITNGGVPFRPRLDRRRMQPLDRRIAWPRWSALWSRPFAIGA